MYTFFIVLIIVAAILLILAVLVQSPKGGMAANFGVSNEVMGVRQTADFLEKATWFLAVAIVVLSLAATMSIPSADIQASKSALERSIEQSVEGGQDFGTLPVIPMELPAGLEPAVTTDGGDSPLTVPIEE